MPTVEFEDKNTRAQGVERIIDFHDRSRSRGIGAWMIRHNITKSRSGADLVMVILTVFCIAVSVYLSFG